MTDLPAAPPSYPLVVACVGVVSAYYVVPLVMSGAAISVVLLLLPGAREWFRRPQRSAPAAAG